MAQLLKYIDRKVNGAYVRLWKLNHTIRPMLDEYAPPPQGSSSTKDYLAHLRDRHPYAVHIPRENSNIRYTFSTLDVGVAWHMKSKEGPRHEFIILKVNLPPPTDNGLPTPTSDDPPSSTTAGGEFYLKVDRTWNNPNDLSSASRNVRDTFNKILKGLDLEAARWVASLDSSALSSATLSGAANDTVVLIDTFPCLKKNIIIEQVSFPDTALRLTHAICMAAIISAISPIYSVFAEQCYFYASAFMALLKEEGKGAVKVERDGKEMEEAMGTGTIKTTKGGKIFKIPIFKFKQSVFEELIWPLWVEEKPRLEAALEARTHIQDVEMERLQRAAQEAWEEAQGKVQEAEGKVQEAEGKVQEAEKEMEELQKMIAEVRKETQEERRKRLLAEALLEPKTEPRDMYAS